MKPVARYRIRCIPAYMYAGWVCLLTAICAAGCDDNPLLPAATGKDGEVMVVVDNRLWNDSALHRTLRAVIAPDYPALPNPEPLFDIIEIKESNLTHLLRTHRNIMILQISDSTTSGISPLRNKWAAAQTVMLIRARSAAAMTDLLIQQREQITTAAEQADRNHAVAALKRHGNTALRDTLSRLFGGSPWFTDEYVLRKKTPSFVWIEFEPSEALMGIFIYRYPYADSAAFQLPNLVAARDAVLRSEVAGQFDGAYMTTSPLVPPQVQRVRHRDAHIVEMRGWWDMQNDFMGGPFVSHTFIAPSGDELITLEAFVYNPRGNKRPLLRRLEAVLYSFESAKREE